MSAAMEDAADAEPKRRRKEAPESIPDALDAGRDPKVVQGKDEFTLRCAEQESLDGITCGEGEDRWYVLAAYEDVGRFLPLSVKRRDPDAPSLPLWNYVKVLPIEWFSLVYEVMDTPGKFRAVPDEKMSLEGYPAASRSKKDPDTKAGFATRENLRLALRPQAFRFYWFGVHEPMLEAGAWPTTRTAWSGGYRLSHETRTALLTKLTAVPATAAWLPDMRKTLEQRHWPSAAAGHANAEAGPTQRDAEPDAEPAPGPAAAADATTPAARAPWSDEPARQAATEAREALATAAEERAAALARAAAEAAAAAAAAQAEATAARARAAAGTRCAACGDVPDLDEGEEACEYAVRFKCEPASVLCGLCCTYAETGQPVCDDHLGRGERLLLCSNALPYKPAKCTGGCVLVGCELDCAKYGDRACADCISVHRCSRRECTNLRTRCPSCPDYFDGETRCEKCRTNEDIVGTELEKWRREARWEHAEPGDEGAVERLCEVSGRRNLLIDRAAEVANLDAATLLFGPGALAERQEALRAQLARAGKYGPWSRAW